MRPVWLAVGFLTWLPVPGFHATERELGRAVGLFPLVGLGLGALLAGAGLLIGDQLPPALRAGLLVAMLAWITGGLHLDGLADTFDGLGAAAKPDPAARRAKMLEVMRDPRTGPHGAVALVLGLGLKILALAELSGAAALLLFPMVGRAAAAALVVSFPSARPDGLGRAFQSSAQRLPTALGALATLGVGLALGVQAALAVLVGLGAALLLGAALSRRLGGLTGDVYGAAVELAEVAALIALCWRG